MTDKRKLNWRPDLPDHRDKVFAPLTWRPIWLLPKKIDLRAQCSPVEDQGNLGSCTGNAIAGALELLELKKGMPVTDISRLFIYYNEREYENSIGEDSGAYIRDGIKSLRKIGAASEAIWPYDINRFAERPPKAAYDDAASRQFRNYYRIMTLSSMLNCLAAGYPFVFGFSVYSQFMSSNVARTGVVNMPEDWETMEGGHAVLAVGYDKASKRFIVRNSWGKDWGVNGYFSMPWDYLSDRNLSDDFWTVRG